MKLRLYEKRVVVLDYAPTIDHDLAAETDTIRVKTLTGNLVFNINDSSAKDGDYFKLIVQADGSARTVNIGGPQGAPGTIALTPSGVAVVMLVFSEGAGKYFSTVTPS